MTVLLSCSTSWCQNENHQISFTGELTSRNDSVLVSYDDLRKANAKMVELKYQKEINDSLRSIIKNDAKIISGYNGNINVLQKQIREVKRQRNCVIGGGLLLTISLALVAIFK